MQKGTSQVHPILKRIGLLLFLCILASGLMHARPALAAQELAVSIPYSQTWTNHSDRENAANTFHYILKPADSSSPAPVEADGGSYHFKLSGTEKGNLDLHFQFSSPGYYHYNVTSDVQDRVEGYSYEPKDYQVMIMVQNGKDGLVTGPMTIADVNHLDEKFDALEMHVSYYEESQQQDQGGGGQPTATPTATATARASVTAPAQPQTVTEPPAETPEPATDDGEVIEDDDTPLTSPDKSIDDYWALLNLLLMIATIVVCIIALALNYRRRKEENSIDYETDEEEESDTTNRLKFVFCLLGAIAAVISVILFFWTEDVRLPVEWTDEWTIWMIIILIAEAVFAVLSRIRRKENEEEGEAS